MKNLITLNTLKEREDFLQDLWATEEFKESFNAKGYVYQKTKDFLSSVRFLADPSDLNIEHSHFYSWFNILINKDYQNKTIQDLYFLHELVHITSMPYKTDWSFEDWAYKMLQNEIEASIESEVMVYRELKIREKSLPFKIWADTISPSLSKAEVFFERMRATHVPKNDEEKGLAKYLKQNFQWFELWKDKFLEVENQMKEFYQSQNAIEQLIWIEKMSTEGVIYLDKAQAFSLIYHENNKTLFSK